MAVNLSSFSGINFKTSRKTQITALHKFIFESDGDRNNRKRLREFQGFVFDETHELYNQKCNYVNTNLKQADLTSICILLGLRHDNSDPVVHIFQNLRKGYLLKDAVRDEDELNETANSDDEGETTVVDGTFNNRHRNHDDEIGNCSVSSDEKSSVNMNVNKRIGFNFRDVEDLLEKFSGDGPPSIQKWIADFEEMVVLHSWNGLETINFARRLLSDSAKRFVNYEKCAKTWSELKLNLIREFGEGVDSKEVHRELSRRKIKSNESYQSYIYVMMEIAGQCNIERRAVFQYIIEGIPDEPTNKAILHGAKTVRELKEKFKEYDSMKKENSSKNKFKTEVYGSKDVKKKSVISTSGVVKRCFNCGGQDHLSANCPSKNKGIKCFKCNEFGHIATRCQNKPKDACLISHSGKTYEAEVLINGKNSVAVIDTGSELSLITKDEYERIGSPVLRSKEITFVGVGSKTNKTLGEFTATVKVNDAEVMVMMHVVNLITLNHRIILGTDFIDQIELNIKNGVMTFSKPKTEDVVPFVYKIDLHNENEDHHVDNLSHISDSAVRTEVASLIKQYVPLKIKDVGIETKIILKSELPVACRPRRLSPSEKEEVDKQMKKWQDDGIIRESNSEYASPIVLVRKKNGETRICVDYRDLNKLIERPRYPLPLIEDQLDALQGAKVFTLIDLKNGFFHVPIAAGCQKFTAFVTPTRHFEFLKTPFGLSISPIIFQKFINAVFKYLIEQKVVVTYMDDIIILAKDEGDALNKLRITLKEAADYGLMINWRKCRFLQNTIEYLGHIVSNGTIMPSMHKTKAAVNFPKPTSTKGVQSFLGLTGYFRKFIPQYSLIARPLTELLKKDVVFEFGNREIEAFDALKTALASEPVLRLYKVEAETELHTDACRLGYGMILMQKCAEDRKFHPVYYASGKTTAAEENYTSYELEVLAIIKALKKFRVYLLGIKFKIITDCQAFSMTMKKRELCVRVARWVLLLEEFSYEVCHRSGKSMKHVDALSRYPLRNVLLIKENENELLTRLKSAQLLDANIQKLIEETENQEKCDYVLKHGMLYKNVNDDLLIVVPADMQIPVARRAHERGHFGVTKTEEIIKQDFWFRNLRSVVERVVASCIDCILAERKHGKQEGFLHAIEKGEIPLDTYHIDHLGPMTTTKKKYQYVFIIVDAFTKFVWIHPTKSTDAAAVIECLRRQSDTFGNPRRIVSDRGPAFTSNAFREYCSEEQIEHILITTGVPRSNGQVERVNRTLIPLLTKLTAPNPENWYKYVYLAQKYINHTVNQSTGKAPFQLMFGTNMRVKNESSVRELLDKEWAERFDEERNVLRDGARERIQMIQEANRKSYNRNRKQCKTYSIGELVAIKRTQFGPGLKLHGKFLGPYAVVHVLRNDRYVVEKRGQCEGPRNTTTSADYMKPWVTGEKMPLVMLTSGSDVLQDGRM